MEIIPLDKNEIKAYLTNKSLNALYIFDSLESTNTTARQLQKAGAKHATLIAAESQSGGKGRYGRYFHSPKGTGIYFSILLERDKLPVENSTLLTIFAGVCTCRALRQLTGKEIQIKWINDIFLKGKKIGGILAEAVDGFFILGIGLNITPSTDPFPEEIGEFVEFLYEGCEVPVSRNEIIGMIVSNLLEPGSQSDLLQEYKTYSAVLGNPITITEGKLTYEGKALDIDEKGRLIIEKENGLKTALCSGEVRIKL